MPRFAMHQVHWIKPVVEVDLACLLIDGLSVLFTLALPCHFLSTYSLQILAVLPIRFGEAA